MQAGKIQAKFRNSTPICLIVEGKEVKRYKSIDFPDALKALDVKDCKLDIAADEKITCHLIFDKGVLPTEFPAIRQKTTWAEMKARKAERDAAEKHTAEIKIATSAPITAQDTRATSPNVKTKAIMPITKETKPAPVVVPLKAKEQPPKAEIKAPATAKTETKPTAKPTATAKK